MLRRTPQVCEIKLNGAWQPIPIVEARAHHTFATKRCPACHGRISLQSDSMAEGGLRVAHRRAHDGCPLIPDRYVGRSRPHPQALG